MIAFPRDDAKYRWTNHAKRKMAFYGLSGDRIKRVIRNPKRVEDGVVENTVAIMQPMGTKKKLTEIWVMYQRKVKSENKKVKNLDSKFNILNSKLIIISAWRYPGISKPGAHIPIPRDILAELKEEGVI